MDNTLQAKIVADFSSSISSANKFGDEILDIAEVMDRISKSTKELNLNIAEKIRKEITSIRTTQESLNIDMAGTIKEKIEAMMTKQLLNRKMSIKGGLQPLEIELTKVQQDKLNTALNRALVNSISEATGNLDAPGGLKLPKFRIPKSIGLEISEALNKFVLKNLKTPSFTWQNDTADLEKIRQPVQFRITNDHLTSFIRSTESKFTEILSQKGMVNLVGIKPLNIKASNALNNIVGEVQRLLDTIDDTMESSIKQVNKMPMLAKTMSSFSNDLNLFITQLDTVSQELKYIELKVDATATTKIQELMKRLERFISDSILSSLNNLNKNISSTPLSSMEVGQIKTLIDSVNVVVADKIINPIKKLKESLSKSSNITQISPETMGKELSSKISSYIKESLDKVAFKSGTTQVNLDESVKLAVRKVEEAVRTSIKRIYPTSKTSISSPPLQDINKIKEGLKSALPDWTQQLDLFEQEGNSVAHIGKFFKTAIQDRQRDIENVKKAAKGDLNRKMSEVVPGGSSQNVVGDYVAVLNDEINYFKNQMRKAQEVLKAYKPSKQELPMDDLISQMSGFIDKVSKDIMKQVQKEVKQHLARLVKESTNKATVADIKALDLTLYMTPVKKALDSYGVKYVKAYITQVANSYKTIAKEFKPVEKVTSTETKQFIYTQMEKNIDAIMKQFNKSLLAVAKMSVGDYKEAMKKVEVTPDLSIVSYMSREMMKLQSEIVKKIREVLSMQFRLMTDEIRAMKVMPTSVGYNVPQYAQRAVASTQKQSANGLPRQQSIQPTNNFITQRGNSLNTMPFNARGVNVGKTLSDGTRTFMGSVVNTMRYITAGSLMGVPMMAMHQAWSSAKDFDYQLEKARLNLLAKDQTMMIDAERRVKERYERAKELGAYGISAADYNNDATRAKLIKAEASNLKDMTRDGIIKPLQDIAIRYAISQADAGAGWQIATRRLSDPYEALALTRSASRIYGYEREEISMEEAAKGLEAISSQWGLTGYDMDKVSSMALMTAMVSQATVKDILDAQSRSGAMFRTSKPIQTEEDKQRALAESMVYQSLFVQSTARSGTDAGTFWKSILSSMNQTKVVDYLSTFADTPGFEALKPFQEKRLDNGDVLTYQKGGIELFKAIMTVSDELRKGGREKERNEMLIQVFKRFQIGNEQAIQAMVMDMEKAYEGANQMGYQGIEDMVQQLLDADPFEIEAMVEALSNNFKFREQRLKTMWEVASFSIIDEFKPEVGNLFEGLTSALRVVRDNAETFAGALKFLVKAMMALGVKKLGEKSLAKFNNFMLNEEFKAKSLPMIQQYQSMQRRAYDLQNRNIRREAIAEKLWNKRQKIQEDMDKVQKVKAEAEYMMEIDQRNVDRLSRSKLYPGRSYIDNRNNFKNEMRKSKEMYRATMLEASMISDPIKREELISKAQGYKSSFKNARSDRWVANHLQRNGNDIASELQESITSLNKRKRTIGTANKSLSFYTRDLELVDKLAETNQTGVSKNIAEMDKLGNRAQLLKGNIETMGLAFTQLGMNGNNVSKMLNKLNLDLVGNKITGQQYEAGLKQIALTSQESAAKMGVMDTRLQKLNKDFLTGSINAKQYVTELNRLQGTLTSSAGPGKGILSVASLKGLGGMLKGGLKSLGKLGLIMAAMDIASNAITGASMSEGDLMSRDIDRRKKSINTGMNMQKYMNPEEATIVNYFKGVLGASVSGLSAFYQAVTTGDFIGVAKNLWNTAAGGKDYAYEKAEIDKMMIESAKLRAEEEKKQREINDKVFLSLGGGKRADSNVTSWEDVYSPEQGQAMIDRINKTIAYNRSTLETDYTIGKTGLMLRGYREDSEEIRNLTRQMIEGVIEEFKWGIEQANERMKLLEEAQPGTYQDNEAWKEANQKREELQRSLAENQLALKQTEMSKFDSINNQLTRDLSMLDATSSIELSDALLKGYSQDSQYYKDLEKKALQDRNMEIGEAISKLEAELPKLVGGEREDILLQIKNLQAESKDNLVKIHKALTGGATFNIPTGVKPITYFESLARNNTERVMSVQQGNIQVSMVIDKVYASDKATVEKEIAEPVIAKVTETLRSRFAANELTRQTNRGVNFRPIR